MTIAKRAELAAEKHTSGYNCCQSVVLALADLTELSEEELLRAASGFAAGMGGMEGSCGALVGTVLIAGLCGAGRSARKISDLFSRKAGALTCKTLKGKESGAPLLPCADCVRTAVIAFGEAMEME